MCNKYKCAREKEKASKTRVSFKATIAFHASSFVFRIVEAPPSYIETVINKIIGNIRIYCNNLILKYVEEDIVLSMNVKLLTFESANNQWEPAYIGNKFLFFNLEIYK